MRLVLPWKKSWKQQCQLNQYILLGGGGGGVGNGEEVIHITSEGTSKQVITLAHTKKLKLRW